MAPACADADPAPFGHACAPEAGVLFCPGVSDSERIPSFDGVPLDVDVTLPGTGSPPYPTVVMLHSFGGDKLMLESDAVEGTRSRSGLAIAGSASLDHYNNLYFASRGFAVVNASSRG
jgi:predicted acyl esterase